MDIRTIQTQDEEEIEQLIRAAFEQSDHGYNDEAKLVTNIRNSSGYVQDLEVVAVTENGKIVGHGLMSPCEVINEKGERFFGLVLAPLSVSVSYQSKGIGGEIVNELEKRAQKGNDRFVSILGDPTYYARFHYVRASKYQIFSSDEVPDEAFMIKPLYAQALQSVQGTLRYSSAFEL